ncbi:hypothetical protein [Pacificimonas flava]|uniref:Uncharacterized protein n=1 Tax=Pacificimonas flava TaxID=1234595 RepID=M2SFR1_9SPHN|nr:hypothetical protein [Pacificimonas flava]EMD84210.1 hypothetical protein C725_0140 [Pacificimonas flava]MBB5279913.1 hypothetical protein [Pacificimonas flava]
MAIAPNKEEGGKRPVSGISPGIALLRDELANGRLRTLRSTGFAGLDLTLARGHDALWLLMRKPGSGGLAYRVAFFPAGIGTAKMVRRRRNEAMRAEAVSPLGRHRVAVALRNGAIPMLRVKTTLTPAEPLLASFVPRDLYPLDESGDPAGAVGQVEAAQRGFNTGSIYFRLTEPDFGSVLYLQDLTALNDFFAATKTKPDGAMGGVWPEIGYLMPTPPQQGTPPVDPLPAEEEITLSDGWIAFHRESGGDEQNMARRYLTLLGKMLEVVERPQTEFHDWMDRAERTLHDLSHSPKATIRHYGHLYLHPYTAAEYPDSMVQLSVLAAIRDYETWARTKVPIGAKLAAGLGKFYDSELGTLRRYLPNVGKDKDANAIDSWYLYHPLSQLGRLAVDGDKAALNLFEKSIGFGIKAARHFEYKWPIQYDLRDFSVITAARDDQELGQTDVGGLYAYVMLQAFDLTDDKEYLDEARAAIDAAKGMRFELNYQANLTAWGAAACMRLWRITNEETYLRQSYVFLASFFHNTAMWESRIDYAKNYRNFLGVTALHDAPYMALYECFDSFAAFERLLKDSGPDLDPSARLLVTEYCRYTLDRAWFYYPDALPPEAISPEQREGNGHIDPTLSFPVEDLYVDGQPAGQVGQEIYGCGAAFVFASRAFHSVEDGPFRIFCDHFLLASHRPSDRALSFELGGCEGNEAMLALVSVGRKSMPSFTVMNGAGDAIRASSRSAERMEYRVPADSSITIMWN